MCSLYNPALEQQNWHKPLVHTFHLHRTRLWRVWRTRPWKAGKPGIGRHPAEQELWPLGSGPAQVMKQCHVMWVICCDSCSTQISTAGMSLSKSMKTPIYRIPIRNGWNLAQGVMSHSISCQCNFRNKTAHKKALMCLGQISMSDRMTRKAGPGVFRLNENNFWWAKDCFAVHKILWSESAHCEI